jgi:pimeloyl-ACP methyl ester carboxylesterase
MAGTGQISGAATTPGRQMVSGKLMGKGGMMSNNSHSYSASRPGLRQRMRPQQGAAIASLFLITALLGAASAMAEPDDPGQFARINDFDMYYEIHGSGEPLLLLHGFFGCGHHWQPFIEAWAEDYQLIIPDLRGHGRSTNPTGAFTHRQAARDVFDLLDQLEIEAVSSIGISTGGMTLLHMAVKQPERIQALIPVGATIWFPEQARERMRELSADDLPQEIVKCSDRGEAQLDELVSQFRSMEHGYEDMNLTPPQLATIEARTMVVHGEHDIFFPLEIPLEMHRNIPDASLWIIPEGGHVPIYDPLVPFAERVLRFLDSD